MCVARINFDLARTRSLSELRFIFPRYCSSHCSISLYWHENIEVVDPEVHSKCGVESYLLPITNIRHTYYLHSHVGSRSQITNIETWTWVVFRTASVCTLCDDICSTTDCQHCTLFCGFKWRYSRYGEGLQWSFSHADTGKIFIHAWCWTHHSVSPPFIPYPMASKVGAKMSPYANREAVDVVPQ